MTANLLSGRPSYKSSGGVNFGLFLPWFLLTLLVSGLLAAFMFWLYHIGHYYIIIVPLLCGLAVAGMMRLAVVKGHCRSRIVAMVSGFLSGLVLYLGSYYVGMLYQLGPETAAQPNALYWYIRLRLATDVTRDAHTPRDSDRERSPSAGLNWFRFGIESIGVVAIVTASAYRRSRKPYCEQCHKWLVREITTFEPGKEAAILESLQTVSPRALAALCATPAYPTIPNAMLAVEYCPSLKDGMTRDCPTYLSLKSITANPKGATLDTFEQSKGKLLARAVQVDASELPALALRFPVFETYTGRAAVASLRPKEEPDDTREEVPGEFAEVTPLGSDHAGKVLTKKMILIGNALGVCVLVAFIGGLGLLAWGASILDRVDKGMSDAKPAGIALCVIGGASVLSALIGMLFDSSFGGNRILRKAFKAELARRSGVLVDANDPDAIFVEIVPKLTWGKMMLENASDVGLLVVDKARREIRFEGDKERWRVPANAITGCEVEKFVQGEGTHGATKIFYTVLRANRRSGFWEAPIRHRVATGLFSGKRKKLANGLTAAIQEMRGERKMAAF
jgi:hypothetical protein